MCVIIVKNAGIKIPKEKLVSACRVNSDGWGFSYLDEEKKEIKTFHGFNPKGNDPDEIEEVLEKYKEHSQYLHLRFNTRGTSNLENCHPFQVFKNDEISVQFMHNGTLGGFGNDTLSDSGDFTNQILAPLTESYIQAHGAEQALNQESYSKIISEFSRQSSVFVIYNNLGKTLFLGQKGYLHDENSWWSSNVYSFNKTHREPQKSTYYSTTNKNTYRPPEVSKSTTKEKTSKSLSTVIKLEPSKSSKEVSKTEGDIPWKDVGTQGETLGFHLAEARKKKLDWASRSPPAERPSFFDLTSCSSYEELMCMTQEEILDLVYELPEISGVLILDLLNHIYERDHKDKLETTFQKYKTREVA